MGGAAAGSDGYNCSSTLLVSAGARSINLEISRAAGMMRWWR